MTKNDVETVRNFIIDNFLFGDGNGFTEEISFLEEGLIDSMGILELITFLEETFHINIKDDELLPQNLDSLNKITKFLDNKLSVKEEK